MAATFTAFYKKAQKFIISLFNNRLFSVTVLPILVGAVFCSSLLLLNRQAVARGVQLAHAPVAMLSYWDLFSLVQENSATFNSTPVTLVLPNGVTEQVSLDKLGAHIDSEKTINQVFFTGRNNNILSNTLVQLRALLRGIDMPYQGTVDETKLSDFITTDLAQFNNPAQNATPVYDDTKQSFAIQAERSGIIIDKQQLENDLYSRIKNLSTQEIVLHQRNDIPRVSHDGALDALAEANALLPKLPLTLTYSDGNISVKQSDVISWMSFAPDTQSPPKLALSFDAQKVQDHLTLLAPGLDKEAVDAQFQMQDNKVSTFQASQEGRTLDIQKSSADIIEALMNAAASPLGATLVFANTDPAISSASIQNLGITKLLAKGTTSFVGSHQTRVHNIEIGSAKYDGVLIAPGEEFSFDKTLGPVTAKEGYVPELVIEAGRTVPEYGGGLCQVSTTMFQTAVEAGLQVTERYNHAYVVKYYGTPGFDATIYPPNPDLKFINNTPGYILIQHQIEGTKLSFEMYGTDDGRKVQIDGPHVYDRKSNGAMKAVLTQTVLDAQGNTMFQKSFYSNYASPLLYPVKRNPLD